FNVLIVSRSNNQKTSREGRNMKKFNSVMIMLLVVTFMSGCSNVLHLSDAGNPCANKFYEECEEWQRKFPKEYARYVKRQQKADQARFASDKKKRLSQSYGQK
ncbi:MAG TPA: hypothetical protein PKM91_18290, partial [Cyclobacteriaceae bacterium]|nr:hypothetical protein [Cyclobacteriaceae bacterium]